MMVDYDSVYVSGFSEWICFTTKINIFFWYFWVEQKNNVRYMLNSVHLVVESGFIWNIKWDVMDDFGLEFDFL